jgi:hypothetical protein
MRAARSGSSGTGGGLKATTLRIKYLLFKFDCFIVKLKPTNGSKDDVSHAEFWSSAVFGRTEECSREILKSANPRHGAV